MDHARPWSLRAAVGATAIATALVGSTAYSARTSPADAAAGQGRVLQLRFNDDLTEKSPHFANAGSAGLSVTLQTRSGGKIREARGRLSPATNTSIRMPAFAPGIDGPRAVVKVVDRKGADSLDPGTRNFTFGADFTRLVTSERNGSYDNGDNLIQRGLFGNRSQYKIQLDHGRATCRIKGSDGAVQVASPVAISAATWYRARCTRSGSTVKLAVTRWSSGGAAVTTVTSATGRTGSLTPAASTVPLSIGGKLSAAGRVLDASDQFNGRIDNAVLQFN